MFLGIHGESWEVARVRRGTEDGVLAQRQMHLFELLKVVGDGVHSEYGDCSAGIC